MTTIGQAVKRWFPCQENAHPHIAQQDKLLQRELGWLGTFDYVRISVFSSEYIDISLVCDRNYSGIYIIACPIAPKISTTFIYRALCRLIKLQHKFS